MGKIHSQDTREGEIGLTASVGASLIGTIFDVVTGTTGVEGNSRPVLNIMGDYSFSDLVSLGLAFSYQSYEIKFDDSQGDFVDDIRCLNFGARLLLHVVRDEDIDLYLGLRGSYTNWAANSTNTVAGYDPLREFTLSNVGLQPVIGASVFFDGKLGANLELAPVGVYYAAVGLHVRLQPGQFGGN
ncbi:MAG: hypothetical protein AAF694_09825 [Bacteroidota bacterium]